MSKRKSGTYKYLCLIAIVCSASPLLGQFECFSEKPDKYDEIFLIAGAITDLEPCWLKAQALVENSTLDPYAESPAGALGCTQFLQGTWDEVMTTYRVQWKRTDCVASIFAQAFYMKEHVHFFLDKGMSREEAWNFALASYNRGRYGLLRDIGDGVVKLTWNKVKESTAFETVNYVRKTAQRLLFWRRR